MKTEGRVWKFGDNVDTDVIIPAPYLVTTDMVELGKHCMEGVDAGFAEKVEAGDIIVAGKNFGCGSSREHAVWVFEVNDINVVIAESFARIFRQNMFNCGMLAIELPGKDIESLFAMGPDATIKIDMEHNLINAANNQGENKVISFELNMFDRELVQAGGWLAYADKKY